MSMIQAIRDYIATCPFLEDDRMIGVDFLESKPIAYTIDLLPCEPIIKSYVDGSSIRQVEFTFSSREAYSRSVMQQIMNSAFYEDFAHWVECNNQMECYPDFGTYKTVQKIEVISSGYALEVTEKTALYQIQLRIQYYQDWRDTYGKRN